MLKIFQKIYSFNSKYSKQNSKCIFPTRQTHNKSYKLNNLPSESSDMNCYQISDMQINTMFPLKFSLSLRKRWVYKEYGQTGWFFTYPLTLFAVVKTLFHFFVKDDQFILKNFTIICCIVKILTSSQKTWQIWLSCLADSWPWDRDLEALDNTHTIPYISMAELATLFNKNCSPEVKQKC